MASPFLFDKQGHVFAPQLLPALEESGSHTLMTLIFIILSCVLSFAAIPMLFPESVAKGSF